MCPALRDAFWQESGLGVLRQIDSEQANFRFVRQPLSIEGQHEWGLHSPSRETARTSGKLKVIPQ
jgi:hypothetical protein